MTYHIGYRQYNIRYRCFFPKDVLYTNKLLKYIWRFLALQGCQMIENMGIKNNKYFMSMSCRPSNYVLRFHVGEESYRPMTIIYYTKGPFQLTSPTNVTRKGKMASSLSLVLTVQKLHNTTTIFL